MRPTSRRPHPDTIRSVPIIPLPIDRTCRLDKRVHAYKALGRSCTLDAMHTDFALLLALTLVAGCRDRSADSAVFAKSHAVSLAAVVERDVAEVERGIPEGAERLRPFVATPEVQDATAVRRILLRTRREVVALNVAKSTFFLLTDDHGVVLRSDHDPDDLVGRKLFAAYPELAAAGDTKFVTTRGPFDATRAGPDAIWLAASPVGSQGILVTGWTYRAYARRLFESLRSELVAQARGEPGKLSVFYVGLFDRAGVYSSPTTPSVDEQAMRDSDLVTKTALGPCSGTVTITRRVFGYGAVRTPKLGPEVGVYVLRSEI